jgi:hypothetical protein
MIILKWIIEIGYDLNLIDLAYGEIQGVGICKYGNEPSGPINDKEFSFWKIFPFP